MAWCLQATSHYLSQVDPDLCCYIASLGHNELTLCVLNWFKAKWKYNFAFWITAHHWTLQIMFISPLMRDHLKFKTTLKSGLSRGISTARRSSDTSFIVFITVPLILTQKIYLEITFAKWQSLNLNNQLKMIIWFLARPAMSAPDQRGVTPGRMPAHQPGMHRGAVRALHDSK